MATNRLIIDDERNFDLAALDAAFGPICHTVIARNSTQALDALNKCHHWDQIWFDHDLGIIADPSGEFKKDTIRPVVLEIEYLASLGNSIKINAAYIHTSNPVGARWIIDG